VTPGDALERGHDPRRENYYLYFTGSRSRESPVASR
jgi:hypothetical protein